MSFFPKYLRPDGKWQCCGAVQKPHIWKAVRCERVAKINDAWCKQHDPVAVQARLDQMRETAEKKWADTVKRKYAGAMFLVLKDIANRRRRDIKTADLAAEIVAEIEGQYLDD